MRRLRALVVALVVTLPVVGRAEPCPIDHSHAAFTTLLGTYVQGGAVDYAGWKARGDAALDAYLASLSGVCREGYGSWSRAQRLAFWINAYNAFTIRLILDHYPIASIRKIGLLPGAAFRRAFIPMPSLKGGTISLDDIEHRTLRPEFREPRVHFALVCASRSCPPLRAEAYRADVLERQLDDQGRTFLGDASKNRVDVAARTLHLSSIFSWFEEDFVAAAGSVPRYVARFLAPDAAAVATAPDVTVRFLDYDWSLNGR